MQSIGIALSRRCRSLNFVVNGSLRHIHVTPHKSKQPENHHGSETSHTTRASSQRKSLRSSANVSLRSVAAEAERSRDRSEQAQSRSDGGIEGKTRDVTAYCAAEQYSMFRVAQLLQNAGHTLDPCGTLLYPQVIHLKLPAAGRESRIQNLGDVFVFPSGTVVAWDVSEKAVYELINTSLVPAAENPHPERIETEDLDFYEDPSSEKSAVQGETIRLGTKPNPSLVSNIANPKSPTNDSSNETIFERPNTNPQIAPQHDTNVALAKIAFSSGLARSTKLAVLESAMARYFESTRSIPTELSRGSKLRYTRSFILRKTGELLSVRAQLNLYSELTDSLPDLFWDSRHELGLERSFEQVGKTLDVGVRISVLNKKMDYAQEIATVLRERLSEKHGWSLEWAIIILIVIEVGFEVLRLWRENEESRHGLETEMLLRRYLEKGLEGENAAKRD